jgi:pimeloyl-ACP methyl ester carboxylesterase
VKSSTRLTGADGGPLRVDVRRAGDAAATVVVCHGFKGFKDWGFFPVIAERLARAGFAVVSFNFSGSGVGEDGETFSEPERFSRATYTHHVKDLDLVLEALGAERLGFRPPALGLLGHSMGGGIAALRAAADSSITALVTWAATARLGRLWPRNQIAIWRRTGKLDVVNQRTGEILPLYADMLDDWERNARALDVTEAAARVRAPWLLAHGTADESVPVQDVHELAARATASQVLLVEGAGHTFGISHPWRGSTLAFDRLCDATVDWFAHHLRAS